jgi:hypothetical protein
MDHTIRERWITVLHLAVWMSLSHSPGLPKRCEGESDDQTFHWQYQHRNDTGRDEKRTHNQESSLVGRGGFQAQKVDRDHEKDTVYAVRTLATCYTWSPPYLRPACPAAPQLFGQPS